MRTRSSRFALGLLVLLSLINTSNSLRAQSATDANFGSRVEYDAASEIYHFRWWGAAGRTFFLSHSEDLITWFWLPMIEAGDGSAREWSFPTDADRFFLRLIHFETDAQAPYERDLDGDSIPDWWELMHNMSPFESSNASEDLNGDGVSNLSQFLSGHSPSRSLGGGAADLLVLSLLE